MATDFPNTGSLNPGDSFTDPNTGITYFWYPPVWKTDFVPNTDADTRYVEVAGDNMTGDLTLGTDKITLNATDGSADFAEKITVGVDGSSNFLSLQPRGIYSNTLTGNNSPESSSATLFVGHDWGIANLPVAKFGYGNPNGDGSSFTDTITFNRDGSAEFDGDINIANYDVSKDANGISLKSTGQVEAQCDSLQVDTFRLFRGTRNTTEVFNVKADGSAEFAGDVRVGSSSIASNSVKIIGGDSKAGEIQIGNTASSTSGWNRVYAGIFHGFRSTADQNDSLLTLEDRTGAGQSRRQVIDFRAGGDATFAGSITAAKAVDNCQVAIQAVGSAGAKTGYLRLDGENSGSGSSKAIALYLAGTERSFIKYDGSTVFNLEPDDDSNYTTTTEEYTETETYTGPLGNTLEREVTKTRDIRTYTGPTLDVKDRLQNLISRMDALEADEVTDDATSTLLLTTVNNINAQMTKINVALAAIRAAANTAGTLDQLKSDIAAATADI